MKNKYDIFYELLTNSYYNDNFYCSSFKRHFCFSANTKGNSKYEIPRKTKK